MTMTEFSASSEAQEIIDEAVSLMQASSFNTSKGDLLTGKSVRILIDPRWDNEEKVYQLLITFYALGQCQVPWKGMPVIIKPVSDVSLPTFIGRLNSRGQTIIKNLLHGNYKTSLSEKWYFSEQQIIKSTIRAAIRQRGEPERTPIFQSNDSRVSVTIEQLSPGRISLCFETSHKELDGAKIHFCIIRSTGEVSIFGDALLSKVDRDHVWQGSWVGEHTQIEACYLMFEVYQKS